MGWFFDEKFKLYIIKLKFSISNIDINIFKLQLLIVTSNLCIKGKIKIKLVISMIVCLKS